MPLYLFTCTTTTRQVFFLTSSMHQSKLALKTNSSTPTSVILLTNLIPTLLLELMHDTELRCMRKLTIGCSDLYLDSVTNFGSYNTGKLKKR